MIATLVAAVFFQKKIWATGGLVDLFVLFFIRVGSRCVVMAGMTPNLTASWVAQQARSMAMEFDDEEHKPTHLIRDNDGKFPPQFDEVFNAENVEMVRTCVQSPSMNAFMERWLQSFQVEFLDHFVVFGEYHFLHLIKSNLTQYHEQRPRQSLDNLPLDGRVLKQPSGWKAEQIACADSLGGVLKSYSWTAAA